MSDRISKDQYYLNIAKEVAHRATCLRKLYGAVIVKNDEIIATGYNGAPRGRKNCTDIGVCVRKKLGIPSGQRYELCRSVHAEMNAIISAKRADMIDATLYLWGEYPDGRVDEDPDCCSMCKRMVLNSGIKKIVTLSREFDVSQWIMNDDTLPSLNDKLEEVINENGVVKANSLKVGDEILNKEGKPAKILGIYPR